MHKLIRNSYLTFGIKPGHKYFSWETILKSTIKIPDQIRIRLYFNLRIVFCGPGEKAFYNMDSNLKLQWMKDEDRILNKESAMDSVYEGKKLIRSFLGGNPSRRRHDVTVEEIFQVLVFQVQELYIYFLNVSVLSFISD